MQRGIPEGALAILFAIALLAGCEGRGVSQPETAAEAGRSVLGTDPDQRSSGEPAGPRVPNPLALETADDIQVNSEPVVAARPAVNLPIAAAKPEPTGSASAEPRAMARVESQVDIQPAADPSQYPGGIVPASMSAEPLPGGPRVLVPNRNFRAEGDPPALRVNYDDLDLLKVLNMGSPIPTDVVEMFPDWLKELDGKRIRIRGFMYPSYTTQLTNFVLTRDMGVCCFGPNPRIYYLISVKLKEGTQVEYIPGRPFDVVGTFHINPIHDDQGNWFQLWSITDATVIE